jgi:hypothetical protein
MRAATEASTQFAELVGMTPLSRSAHHLGDVVGRIFNRVAAVIVGFIMMAVGLAMTATIVMLPVGIVVGLIGVLVFVGGFYAPDQRTERPRDI